MKRINNIMKGLITVIILFIIQTNDAKAQWRSPATVGSRPEVVLSYSYQWVTAGKGHQDLKIICKNITTDKIAFKINYEVHFYNGEVERVASDNVIELKPGETFDPKSVTDWGGVYMRYFLTATGGKYGSKEKWFQFGKDNNDRPLYSAIHSVMKMQITNFVNLSAKEREEKEKVAKAQAEAKIIAEEKARKIAESSRQTTTAKEASSQNVGSSSSSTPHGNKPLANSSSGSNTATATATPTKDDTFRAASSFQGGLGDIREGDVFKNDKGEYFQKVGGNARQVDKSVYDKIETERITAQLARQESERKEKQAVYNQAIDDLTNVATGAIMSIQADREARLEREYAAYNKANETIKAFSQLASEGNAEALKKVNNAYYSLAYYNNEEKTGWTGAYSIQREEFLRNTLHETSSPYSKDLLLDFYEEQKNYALARRKKAVGRAIGFPLLAGAVGYGGYLAFDKIMVYEDGEFKNEAIATVCLVTGIVGGLGFYIWGMVEAGSIGSRGKKSEIYQEAERKQNEIKNRFAWKLLPKYNPQHNATMLSLNVTF